MSLERVLKLSSMFEALRYSYLTILSMRLTDDLGRWTVVSLTKAMSPVYIICQILTAKRNKLNISLMFASIRGIFKYLDSFLTRLIWADLIRNYYQINVPKDLWNSEGFRSPISALSRVLSNLTFSLSEKRLISVDLTVWYLLLKGGF